MDDDAKRLKLISSSVSPSSAPGAAKKPRLSVVNPEAGAISGDAAQSMAPPFAGTLFASAAQGYAASLSAMMRASQSFATAFRAGNSVTALNSKLIDLAQDNVKTYFEFAQRLACAKNTSEILEVQAGYFSAQLAALSTQAGEIGKFSTRMVYGAMPFQRQAKSPLKRSCH